MKIPGISAERLTIVFSWKPHVFQARSAFNVKAIPAETKGISRVTIVSGKKTISKLAVYRNRADRRINSALQTVYPQLTALKAYDLVFYANPAAVTMPWTKLLEEMKSAISNMEEKAVQNAVKRKDEGFEKKKKKIVTKTATN